MYCINQSIMLVISPLHQKLYDLSTFDLIYRLHHRSSYVTGRVLIKIVSKSGAIASNDFVFRSWACATVWLLQYPTSSFHTKQNAPLTQLRPIFYRAVVRGQSSLKVGINFPLGRPTADNIQSICQNKKLRPLYSVKCLVGPQYKLLARQAKSINRMEKGFKLCCKKEQHVLNCAEEKVKWEACIYFAKCSSFVALFV